DRLLVDTGHELESQRRQPTLRVPHRGWAGVRIGRPEVAVPVDEWMTQAEVLHHASQGVVDGTLAVGVELAHHVADHTGALGVRSVGPQTLVVHPVEDAAVDRFSLSRASGSALETMTDMEY